MPAQPLRVLAALLPVITSLLAEVVVESAWLISTEPMSGRLPAGSGRALAPSLAGGASGERVGAAQRRVGEVVQQRHDADGVELAAAGVGVDAGEDGAGGDVLAVARDVAEHVAAEDVVAVAEGDRARDVRGGRIAVVVKTNVTGHDAVGDVELGRCLERNTPAMGIGIIGGDGTVANDQSSAPCGDPATPPVFVIICIIGSDRAVDQGDMAVHRPETTADCCAISRDRALGNSCGAIL